MQLLHKDTIIRSFVGQSGQILHQTTSGFQFGSGRERSLVTSIEQVQANEFGLEAVKLVSEWIGRNGVISAKHDIATREVEELASAQPGTLDALAERLGMKAELYQLLNNAMSKTHQPPSPRLNGPVESATELIDGKPAVRDAHGIAHILPDAEKVVHPDLIKTDSGLILDKGNGHREFILGDISGEEDEQTEEQIIAQRDAIAQGRPVPISAPSVTQPTVQELRKQLRAAEKAQKEARAAAKASK